MKKIYQVNLLQNKGFAILLTIFAVVLNLLVNAQQMQSEKTLVSENDINYSGKYFLKGKGYDCNIFKKNEQYFFSYYNDLSDAHKLEKNLSSDSKKYQYKCSWISASGLSTEFDLGFITNNNNVLLLIRSFYKGQISDDVYFKDKNIPGAKKTFFNLTFVNKEPSTAFKFWVEYEDREGILLDGETSYTDINIKKGKYNIEYKFYKDGILKYHRNGYLVIDKNKSVDFFKNLIELNDGGIH
jgi:hypothetical protein